MQEGILSLMQMGNISASLARLAEAKIPYIPMTESDDGGRHGLLCDVGRLNIAEPAPYRFAGPRVSSRRSGKRLPDGFQRSEFLLEHGMLDFM